MRSIKFTWFDDILGGSQRTKPLQMELPPTPIITSFDQKMINFGSCFAQNLQTYVRHYGFHFYWNVAICAHYSSPSILGALRMLAAGKKHDVNDLRLQESLHPGISSIVHHYLGGYAGQNAVERILARMDQIDAEARREIQGADICVITLGNTLYWLEPDSRPMICLDGRNPSEHKRVEQTPGDVTRDLEEIYSLLSGFGRSAPPS